MKIFCDRLKELRIEKKLSRTQLASELGFSETAIRRWENEQRIPNIEEVVKIAEFFKTTTDFLLGLNDY